MRRQAVAFQTACVLIRVFYCCLLLRSLYALNDWWAFGNLTQLDPLWPVFWLQFLDPSLGARIIVAGSFITVVFGVFFFDQRWVRILVFVAALEYVALRNSFGTIGHSLHLWLILSFILVFLPHGWSRSELPGRPTRQIVLRLFWCCQALIMLTYHMAGLGKILGAFYQMALGQIHAFHRNALALHIAERVLSTNNPSIVGSWFVEHPSFGWPMMLAAIYLQCFALWAAFRPNLHQSWAGALMLFHIGTSLTIWVNFHPSTFLLALMFLNSPFKPSHVSWRHILNDLPIFGLLYRRVTVR